MKNVPGIDVKQVSEDGRRVYGGQQLAMPATLYL